MLKICKISIFLVFFNLYCYAAFFGTPIRYGTTVFSMVAVFSVLADALISPDKKLVDKLPIPSEIKWWLLFICISILGAVLFAADKTYAIKELIEFAEKLIFAWLIIFISIKDDSVDYPIKMMIVVSTISAITVMLNVDDVSDRFSLSDNANPNKLGNMMLLGIFCAVYYAKNKKVPIKLLSLAICILLTLVMFLSGSRKSLYALLIMLILMFIFAIKNGRILISIKKVIWTIIVALIIAYAGMKLMPIIQSSSMYERLFGRLAERAIDSDMGRLSLYKSALTDWLTNPFFGIGYMNFYVKHGAYTHSTYAEILSNCGLFGLITYFAPYISVIIKLKEKAKSTIPYSLERSRAYYIIILSLIYLFIGLGIGQMYDNLSFLEVGVIIGYIYVGQKYDTRHSKSNTIEDTQI